MLVTKGPSFVIAYSTLPDRPAAQALARRLVESRAAACVQLFDVASVYTWRGVVEEAAETAVAIKTVTDRLEAVRELVLSGHPYEVPEFVVVPVLDGAPAYLAWMHSATREGDRL